MFKVSISRVCLGGAAKIPVVICAILGLAGFFVQSAYAASPWWRVTSRQVPAHIAPGGEGRVIVTAVNVGNAPTSGRYELSDVLPAHMVLEEVEELLAPYAPAIPSRQFNWAPFGFCKSDGSSASCSSRSENPNFEELGVAGELKPAVPFEFIEMRLKVKAEADAEPAGAEQISVSGGGAPAVSVQRPVVVDPVPEGFSVGEFTLTPEDEGGQTDTHAGSHPYQLTNTIVFNRDEQAPFDVPAPPRNLHFKLPPGLIGNATALPQCGDREFVAVENGFNTNTCPGDSAIGTAVVTLSAPFVTREETLLVPVFNLTPAYGEPARFGFEVAKNPVILDTALRSGPGEDYGVTVSVNNITELASFISATTTFWGVPADPSHNNTRGWGCLESSELTLLNLGLSCEPSTQEHPASFLTMPTNCQQPFIPTVDAESWPKKATAEGPAETLKSGPLKDPLSDIQGNPLSLTGCNQLTFAPSFEAKPTSESASSPSGLDVNLDFDDEGLTGGTGVAQSQMRDTTVTLPKGLTINPSSGVGLGGCTPADFEREAIESAPGAGCPNDSKLGTVEIESPLIKPVIHGSLFIAQPYENPFGEPEHGHPGGTLVALYIVAKNPETGVIIKLAGKVTPNPETGQLTTIFQNNPQLAFSHFNFHFREGQQAPLVTPATCGSYTTSALLAPWSEPLQPLTDSSPFSITKGSEGGECPTNGAPPFHPQIQAGMQNNNAGSFSPFYLHLTRTDAEQEISGFSTNLPPGLTGDLTGIPFCPEASIALARTKTGAQEEAEPPCPAASQIGHTLVGTGVGAVLAYVPGKLYLGGPYNGTGACIAGTSGCAPFSLVSVTAAKVGPFDLGTVVLRFGLNIDPYTAQVGVSPTTSEPIPTIIDGIVTHVRDIRVYVERPGNAPFTLNPTSCNPMAIGSTLTSNLGASSTVTSPFQAASCASLKFAPKFAVSTSGKTSKENGASLHVNLTFPGAPLGSSANIAKVKVELPKALPSRLTTLQKACTAAQFDANPAGCPGPSAIGSAKAVVPNIPEPLTGPVYFVSHGGEAFPSLEVVLQGYGVKVILVGSTFISKAGITSTTFKTIPDNPVNSFELTLPQGKYSALAANGNLCNQKLTMPTEFVAQNGVVTRQGTKVAVTGCAKKKALTRSQKLAKALKACKKKAKGKRAGCEKTARKDYGPVKKAKQRKGK